MSSFTNQLNTCELLEQTSITRGEGVDNKIRSDSSDKEKVTPCLRQILPQDSIT